MSKRRLYFSTPALPPCCTSATLPSPPCSTAFNREAVRQIVAVALAQGLASTELLQAIQLGAHLAVHGSALGAKVLQSLDASPRE